MNKIISKKAFTFLEILVAVMILSVIVKLGFSFSHAVIMKSKENQLKENLRKIRDAIDKFYSQNENKNIEEKLKYPKTLQELVDKNFIRKIPKDPFSNKEYRTISTTDMKDSFITDGTNVYDLFSQSDKIALDGSKINEW